MRRHFERQSIEDSVLTNNANQGIELVVANANSTANIQIVSSIVDFNGNEGLLINVTDQGTVNYRSINTTYDNNGTNGALDGINVTVIGNGPVRILRPLVCCSLAGPPTAIRGTASRSRCGEWCDSHDVHSEFLGVEQRRIRSIHQCNRRQHAIQPAGKRHQHIHGERARIDRQPRRVRCDLRRHRPGSGCADGQL